MKDHQEKITLNDTVETILFKLGEGNPGAMTVLIRVYQKAASIDPYIGDPLMYLLQLDSLGIYGKDIWLLYKDVCKENLSHTLAMVRAWQMAIISPEDLHATIQSWGKGPLNVQKVCQKLKQDMPNFNLSEGDQL